MAGWEEMWEAQEQGMLFPAPAPTPTPAPAKTTPAKTTAAKSATPAPAGPPAVPAPTDESYAWAEAEIAEWLGEADEEAAAIVDRARAEALRYELAAHEELERLREEAVKVRMATAERVARRLSDARFEADQLLAEAATQAEGMVGQARDVIHELMAGLGRLGSGAAGLPEGTAAELARAAAHLESLLSPTRLALPGRDGVLSLGAGEVAPVEPPAPVVAEPVVAEPVVAEPVVAEPVVAEPVVAERVVAEPVVAEPAPAPTLVSVSWLGPSEPEVSPADNGEQTPVASPPPAPPFTPAAADADEIEPEPERQPFLDEPVLDDADVDDPFIADADFDDADPGAEEQDTEEPETVAIPAGWFESDVVPAIEAPRGWRDRVARLVRKAA